MTIQKPIPKWKEQLVYCVASSRPTDNAESIMRFVSEKGYAPFNQFQAIPSKFFEQNKQIDRDISIKYYLKTIKICDKFWLFGISKETKREIGSAKKLKKPIKRIKIFEDE